MKKLREVECDVKVVIRGSRLQDRGGREMGYYTLFLSKVERDNGGIIHNTLEEYTSYSKISAKGGYA
jgi:hypothetical protein